MEKSLLKAVFVAAVLAAPTAAFATSYDSAAPSIALASAQSHHVNYPGAQQNSNGKRTDKAGPRNERKTEMPAAPESDPFTHWDANENAG